MDSTNLISIIGAVLGFAGSIGAVILAYAYNKKQKEQTKIEELIKENDRLKIEISSLKLVYSEMEKDLIKLQSIIDKKIDKDEEIFNKFDDKLDGMQKTLNQLDYFFALVNDLKTGLNSFSESFMLLNQKYSKIELIVEQLNNFVIKQEAKR